MLPKGAALVNMSWKRSDKLMDVIKYYATFPATGVSLRQMVQFGQKPSTGESIALGAASGPCFDGAVLGFLELAHCTVLTSLSLAGTLFRASNFLSEELPIRLAHRVQELDSLPDGLNEMPSVKKVRDWYAQSFEVGSFPLSHA